MNNQEQSVSHVMPNEVQKFLQYISGEWPVTFEFQEVVATHIKAAYAKIAELQKQLEIGIAAHIECERQLEVAQSQLSTLQAQMKEVVRAGNDMADMYSIEVGPLKWSIVKWKAATASLRQSGHKE